MLEQFAKHYRVAVRRDPEDGTNVVSGKRGNLYEYNSEELGVMFIPTGEPRARLWESLKRQTLAAGMTLRQCGDAEGAFSFDPSNPEQCRLAVKIAGAKRKCVIT